MADNLQLLPTANAFLQAAKLDMPEAADKQRREKFVLSVAYSPGGVIISWPQLDLGRCAGSPAMPWGVRWAR